MMHLLTKTHSTLLNISLLLLRGMVGSVLFVVGAGKVFGWFGGYGLVPMLHIFTAMMGIPAPLAYVSFFTEFVGGFLLIVGLFTRPAAFAVAINMLVATIVMRSHGFIGADGGAAWPMSLMVSAVVILLTGPLAYSIDALLTQKNTRAA